MSPLYTKVLAYCFMHIMHKSDHDKLCAVWLPVTDPIVGVFYIDGWMGTQHRLLWRGRIHGGGFGSRRGSSWGGRTSSTDSCTKETVNVAYDAATTPATAEAAVRTEPLPRPRLEPPRNSTGRLAKTAAMLLERHQQDAVDQLTEELVRHSLQEPPISVGVCVLRCSSEPN